MIRRVYYTPPPPPSAVTWTTREYLRLLLRGRWQEAGEAPPACNCIDYREQSERIYRKTRLPIGCDPRWVLEELDCPYAATDLDGPTRETYAPGRGVRYSARGGPRQWGLLVWHGVLHFVADEHWCGLWRHSDIWLATVEAAVPSGYLLEVGPQEATERIGFVPGWLVLDYWKALVGQI